MMASELEYRQPPLQAGAGAMTRTMIAWLSICLASMLAVGMGARRADASLGGSTGSIAGDAQKLGTVTSPAGISAADQSASQSLAVQTYILRTNSGTKYTYSEFTTAANQRIREFVTPGGKVFGLAWQGPRTPDLQVLLGSYFDRWHDAVNNAGHIPLHRAVIHTSSLVVEMAGPMGLVMGRAWVPALVPAGVNARNVVQ
ncbi:MAG TPA: DUF2844 domain-containing protein [Candidatus Binataceae bacterium]|nr:DUF2844 domain-containing protein [Candidatus Binataceae bacterium]